MCWLHMMVGRKEGQGVEEGVVAVAVAVVAAAGSHQTGGSGQMDLASA